MPRQSSPSACRHLGSQREPSGPQRNPWGPELLPAGPHKAACSGGCHLQPGGLCKARGFFGSEFGSSHRASAGKESPLQESLGMNGSRVLWARGDWADPATWAKLLPQTCLCSEPAPSLRSWGGKAGTDSSQA